ncbi:hypothetical protein [Kitasatospora sp. NPDC097643]|uniref:hypothetical protein n=1 Tax=Kitasatospora sp. NPDC097643 TaxID=3157230 RepID=UPI00332320F3
MTQVETVLAQAGDLPRLTDIGGEDVLWAQADHLVTSPMWFRAAEIVLEEWDSLDHPDQAAAFINRALTTTANPGIAGDILDLLVEHPGYLQHAANQLNSLALERSRHYDTVLEAELAGIFLEAALRLALPGTTKRYGLLDRLVDPQAPTAPTTYARRTVRALATAYEQWHEEDLLTALGTFTGTAVHADALYELAMCHLADALNAPDRPTLLQEFESAQELLQQAVEADEDRPDATAFLAAITAALAFDSGSTEDLNTATEQLRRSLTEHAIWLKGTRTHWRAGRYDTEAAWYGLSISLEQANTHLDQPLTRWPGETIQHILATYTAHRSVRLQPTSAAPGLQVLVAPRIEDAFVRREGLRLHLRALLTEAPDEWDPDAAHQLLQAVDELLDDPASGDPGKAPQAATYPELAAAVGSHVLAGLPTQMLEALEGKLTDSDMALAARLPIAQQQIFHEVVDILKDCPDFKHPAVRSDFIRLITMTIRFLDNRTNRARAHHTQRFSYLFAPNPGESCRWRTPSRKTFRTTSTATWRMSTSN